MFRPLPNEINFSALEEEELERWREHRIFQRSVSLREGACEWVFYEGPPTANGRPGLHHVWARVFKDVFCRYRTMRGFKVARRAGWDTHGLPVEVEVEKQLGISSKRQIEDEIGIGEFTRRCRESVLGYVEDWKVLTERIGYWVDLEKAYWTFDSSYIQSVWWHLKELFDKGLLYEDLKVVPYCPRCGTGLSSHELAQPGAYYDEEDESAYVEFQLNEDQRVPKDAVSLLVWTTTPWTLLSNAGVAVHPDLDYGVVEGKIVALELAEEVFGELVQVDHVVKGNDLIGLTYKRPFDDVQVGDTGQSTSLSAWRVVGADFVTLDEGTGLVHLAPAFGEEDRQVGRKESLPVLNPVGPDGRFDASVSWLEGLPVRDTNSLVNDKLESAGLLHRRKAYVHSYPHCWRCSTALIYWGKPSWYVATSKNKSKLIAANMTIDWHPGHIQEGRFGEWLETNVDWALSRDRFWGTPLPIWQCGNGHLRCIGSLEELSKLCEKDVTSIDPHRPSIDEVTFLCPTCLLLADHDQSALLPDSNIAHRVEPVIDAWFDSGSMPAAQVGYPYAATSKESFCTPADFITEAIDQTRGWFYSLLAVNTLVFGASPYRHVMCLGHIVDAEGKKMSKSIGNVIDPWDIISEKGVDVLRWWMVSQGSPWTPTRVSMESIDPALLVTIRNTAGFFLQYASLNDFDPLDPKIPKSSERPAIDRWVLSRLSSTLEAVTMALENYEPLEATQPLALLIDDLSNWYVRRTRRRFWRTDPDLPASDGLGAQATLHEVLVVIVKMMAPFCPFFADHMWRLLTNASIDDSVHLCDWPKSEDFVADKKLEDEMALARRLSSLGRSARSEAGVRVRQPLRRALVHLTPGSPGLIDGIVEDELNVDEIVLTNELAEVLRFDLSPKFSFLGPRLGKSVKEVKPALMALSAEQNSSAAGAIERGETFILDLPSGTFELGQDDVEIRVQGQSGFAVSREGSEVVALDLEIDEDLRLRGRSRELVRHIQELRKVSGLDVSDRIVLHLEGFEDLRPMFDAIGREILATTIIEGPGSGQGFDFEEQSGSRIWIDKSRVGE